MNAEEGRLQILCLGEGFTSSALARLHPGHDVRFLSRRKGSSSGLRITSREELEGGRFAPDLILDGVPPVLKEGRLINPLYRAEIDLFPLAVYIHLSSTSVYARKERADAPVVVPADEGSKEGTFRVNELTVPVPDDSRGRVRLELEEAVLAARPDAVIVRCGGIYGPGRSLPLSLTRGESPHVPDRNLYVSRIHVNDLCRLVIAIARRLLSVRTETDQIPSLFPGHERRNLICATDPHPSPARETLQFIQREWGLVVPDLPDDPPEGRQVESLYAMSLLGGFEFPDYREGFRDSMRTRE